MPIPTTQKFSSPSADEGKFLAQLERYTQQVSVEINASSSYDYSSAETPTGASYLFLERRLPVYVQTLKTVVSSTSFTKSIPLQSPNQGIVFLEFFGSVTIGGKSYPIPYNDNTDRLYFNISSGGNITINATSLFVGGDLIISLLYVYTF